MHHTKVPEIYINNESVFVDGKEVHLRKPRRSISSDRISSAGSQGSAAPSFDEEFRAKNSLVKSLRLSFSRPWSRKNMKRSKSVNSSVSGEEEINSNRILLRRRAVSTISSEPIFRLNTTPQIEDSPGSSSENASDLEDIRQQIDPALLNGSSGNFGSAGARSAPSTPQGGILGSSPGALSDPTGAGILQPCSLPRSPSHNIFSKYDKGNIKQLSYSIPLMTAQAQSPEPPSPKQVKQRKYHQTSKGRQKKFNRHFPSVDPNAVVLNYYSCALIGDILLQGYLYITHNYFAFYSNVFGYVTKLLIPIQSVEKISKEKTARIIPNAVGITTLNNKHVFGSLMSRDSTYRFMNEVWESSKTETASYASMDASIEPPIIVNNSELSDSSETRDESGRESATSEIPDSRFRKCAKQPEHEVFTTTLLNGDKSSDKNDLPADMKESYFKLATASNQSLFLFITTFILILLFLSAAVLLYRIGKVQNKYTLALQDNFVLSESEDVYGELLQWQTHLHSKSAGAVHNFLDNNLDQIAKVRQSLEALSTLLIPNGHSASQNTATNPMETPDNS